MTIRGTERLLQLQRFERLGLKWNPFRVTERSEKSDVFVSGLYAGTRQAAAIAAGDEPFTQVIANAGSGKSTLLAAVADELLREGTPFEFHYLKPSLLARVPVPAASVRVLIIDEAERLTRFNLQRIARWVASGNRLVVSAHRDISRLVRAQAATVQLSGVTPSSLQQFFEQRVFWSGGDVDQIQLSINAAEWLLDVSGQNLRVIEAVLYEVFQEVVTPDDLRIGCGSVQPFEAMARSRAEVEALGNEPASACRRLHWTFTELSGRTGGKRPGQTSRPGPPGHAPAR